MRSRVHAAGLADIDGKLERGERLTFEDGSFREQVRFPIAERLKQEGAPTLDELVVPRR